VTLFDFLYHGFLLKDIYMSTAKLWRPPSDYNMAFMMLGEFCFAAAITLLFTRNYEGNGIEGGARFGLYLGLVLGALQIGTYAYMPIPLTLTIAWVIGMLLLSVGAGIVLSLTYKN